MTEEEKEVLSLVLKHLPDGEGNGGEDWNWCWNELNSDSQDRVKEVRTKAMELLQ